ncbi:uncharacterized protein BO72DRAFT_435493 [Aspergillus fijiensis CBS 313.89]|uniref:Uncharacterized protein n=1 Tax=Aspergillus fijiensis CBS 313.89 TaxID=1448319 RepID=A0A8G1VYT0_9EURO|nr:uncharacterized protein BO72DRAFT_435493 [Aspergillus fijiensis CBS 313.89]RAK74314.1 hypothetical protein BO72DRAFT_435493 [Aspergillus fijiensis CBS 313.89]
MEVSHYRAGDAAAATSAKFISDEGVKVHQGLGGWSEYNDQRAQFESAKPYRNLEAVLKEHVQRILGAKPEDFSAWEAVFDRVTEAERDWQPAKERGARAIFAKAWLKVGENRELIDPWINIIPDSYGLAVVKVGIAVALNLAAKSAERRQRIIATFHELQRAIVEVKRKRRSFHTDPEVSQHTKDLYIAIVDAIEIILNSLPAKSHLDRNGTVEEKRHFRITSNSKVRRHDEFPEQALQRVKEASDMLSLAAERCRDTHIEAIERYSRDTHHEVHVMRWTQKETEINTRQINADVQVVKSGIEEISGGLTEVQRFAQNTDGILQNVSINVRQVKTGIEAGEKRHLEIIQLIRREEERLNHFIETQSRMMGNSQDARNQMLQFLLEDWRKERSLNLQLQQRLYMAETEGSPRRDERSSAAVVSLSRLLEVLVQSPSNGGQPPDYSAAFGQPNDDLEIVLGKNITFDAQTQSQAQSVLQNVRFVEWMNREHPDLLLVDANLRSFALHNVTPISVFCATFVLSMAEVRPEDVVIHFFCGLHCTKSSKDHWAGPNGLVRSLVCQLLLILRRRGLLSIEFINSRALLKQLEEHDLGKLCVLLHQLARQFPSDVTVYCIIDAVCCFDKDLHMSFQELTTVIEYLRAIVQDDSLRAQFKILMTNADQSTKRLRQQVDLEQHITLSSQYLSLHMISDRSVAAGISRPSTPSVTDTREMEDDDWEGEQDYE